MALFAVFAIFDAKRRRGQTEQADRELDGLRAYRDCQCEREGKEGLFGCIPGKIQFHLMLLKKF